MAAIIGWGVVMLASCRAAEEEPKPLPTLLVLPTLTASPTNTATATPTDTPQPSATQTATATATHTASPTVTATSTATATRTPTPSPTPVQLVVNSEVGAFVRSGPGTVYEVVGEVNAEDVFEALAYAAPAPDDVWYLIEYRDGMRAWISGWVVESITQGDQARIALAATIPPSPTPSPTTTPLPATATPTLLPGANGWIESEAEVNLRVGPGRNFTIVGRLAPRTPLLLNGRNADVTWFQATTFDGQAGWISAEYVGLFGVNEAGLPIIEIEPTAIAAPGGSVTLASNVLQQARTIFQRGQQLGTKSNVFIVIGDSTSGGNDMTVPFFTAFGRGTYNLGGFGYLQNTISFFAGSFGINFQTAQAGFGTSFLLDPMWANPNICQQGETPLTCEIRFRRPAFAFIYIGIIDMLSGTPEAYAQNLDRIVQTLVSNGVVPILSTITSSDTTVAATGNAEKLQAINQSIRQIAGNYQVPLIEFQQASHGLPNQGCVEDGHHLSFRVDGVINFTGDELIYGKDLRELLSLQMLHELRVALVGG